MKKCAIFRFINKIAYTALIRILCKAKDIENAEKILLEAEKCQQCKPKLRLYSSIIQSYCIRSDMEGAIRTWLRMSTTQQGETVGGSSTIRISEREYCALIQCATRTGDAQVMEFLLTGLAEDVTVPSLGTTDAIVKWFQSEHAVRQVNEDETSVFPSVMNKISLPSNNVPSLGPIQFLTEHGSTDLTKWRISNGIKVDVKSGLLQNGCMDGSKLQVVSLTDDSWKFMEEMNEKIVVKGDLDNEKSCFAGGGKGKKYVLSVEQREKRVSNWERFKIFLEDKVGPPKFMYDGYSIKNKSEDECNGKTEVKKRYDFVIDGANVGYYQNNYEHAPKHVNYEQIDWMVQYFLNLGKSTLVVLHERHFSKKLLPESAKSIVEKWDELGVLFRSPVGSNDDWFWMHAALWCGSSCMVVSNDLMRDHHFQMLAYRSFTRWKDRQQVHFTFGEYLPALRRREIILSYPDLYSRRIQRLGNYMLVIPLPKMGDENRFLDGYHKAGDNVPIEETYVCISLNEGDINPKVKQCNVLN